MRVTTAWDQRDGIEQARVRDLLLADWLPTVVAASPYWRRSADRLGISVEQARDLAALQRFRPVRARELLVDDGSGAAAVLAPTEPQVKAHAPTATVKRLAAAVGRRGADGKRDVLLEEYRPLQLQRAGDGLLIASSRSDVDRMHRAGARTAAVLGLRPDDVVVSAIRCGPTLEHLGTVHLAMGASLTAMHPRTRHDFAEVVDAVRALAPSVLVARIDEVDTLAAALQAVGAVPSGLRRLVVVGPPPGAERREALAGPFTAEAGTVGVRAVWAPPESRQLWAECAAGSGLHTYPDLEHLEVVDPFTGVPTEAGGELTLTTLGWHGAALLRYRSGAAVDGLATAPCPDCGRTLPRLVGAIEPSAWQLPFAAADHRGTVDLRGVAAVLAHHPGVRDWRVELTTTADGDHLRIEVAGGVAVDVYDLQDELARACGMVPEVELGVPADEVAAGVERVGGIFADLR